MISFPWHQEQGMCPGIRAGKPTPAPSQLLQKSWSFPPGCCFPGFFPGSLETSFRGIGMWIIRSNVRVSVPGCFQLDNKYFLAKNWVWAWLLDVPWEYFPVKIPLFHHFLCSQQVQGVPLFRWALVLLQLSKFRGSQSRNLGNSWEMRQKTSPTFPETSAGKSPRCQRCSNLGFSAEFCLLLIVTFPPLFPSVSWWLLWAQILFFWHPWSWNEWNHSKGALATSTWVLLAARFLFQCTFNKKTPNCKNN